MEENSQNIINEIFNKIDNNQISFNLVEKVHKPIFTKTLLCSFLISLSIMSFVIKDIQLALSLILVIGFHEFGHIWVAKKMGLNTHGFIFIPLFGGAASIRYHNHAYNNFMSILGGPLFGMILNIILAIIYVNMPSEWLSLTIKINTIVNLFNLLPIGILDGGKIFRYITASMHPIVGLFGLIMSYIFMVILFVYLNLNPVIIILVTFFGFEEFKSDYNQLNFYKIIQKDRKLFWSMFREAERRFRFKEDTKNFNLEVTYKKDIVCQPLSGMDSIFAFLTWIGTALFLIIFSQYSI